MYTDPTGDPRPRRPRPARSGTLAPCGAGLDIGIMADVSTIAHDRARSRTSVPNARIMETSAPFSWHLCLDHLPLDLVGEINGNKAELGGWDRSPSGVPARAWSCAGEAPEHRKELA